MNRELYLTLLLFAATILAVWGFVLVLSPFLVAIAWALCLAAITYPLYEAMRRKWRKPRLAALSMVVLTALVILVPIGLVLFTAGEEFVALAKVGLADGVSRLQEALPDDVYQWVDERLRRLGTEGVEDAARQVASAAPGLLWRPVARGAWEVLGKTFTAVMGLVIMLATQYFVYTDARRLSGWVRGLLPLDESETERIFSTLRTTTSAAVLGGVAVAFIQGALAGIGYAVVGLDAPILWGIVTAFFSLLPFGGAAIVWAPITIYLFVVGEGGNAWMLLVWGMVAVSGIDNFLRPWLLRRTGSRVHPMLLFFAILSGIGLFGMSGIVFGPLLIAFLMTIAQIYREHMVRLRNAVAETGEG